MSRIKSLLRHSYQWSAATFGAHNRRHAEPRLWVLMYHRILPEHDPRYRLEEPGMVVTPDSFRMHLEECQKLFDMVSLNDCVEDFRAGRPIPSKACAVTFDDGWQDNLDYAAPILEQTGIPATLFAVVDKIGTDFRFWPNIVMELFAHNSEIFKQHSLFQNLPGIGNTLVSRETLAAAIDHLKQYSENDIFDALESLNWQKVLADTPPPLMNWPDLKRSPFAVGCHTQTHRRLTSWLSEDDLDYEIIDSAISLKQQVPNSHPLFCYPNGDYDARALQRVNNTYRAAVTTQKGINTVDNLNLHELKRIPIHDDMANTRTKFRARLAAW